MRRDLFRRTGLLVAAVGLVLLLLVLAASVAGRLLDAGREVGAGAELRVVAGDGGLAAVSQRVPRQRAPELPASPPRAAGLLLRRQDNRLFVGTGVVEMTVGEDGREIAAHSGPVVEVVVPHDAAIYREIVEPRDPAAAGPVETSVRPASLEEIGVGGLVSAWGEKRGDRVVAGVLVYTRE